MTKLKAFLRRAAGVPIPVLCYLLVWALWLLVCLGGLVEDTLAPPRPLTLALADFTPVDLEQAEGGALLTTSHDPQLIWQNSAGKLRTFRYAVEISDEGHEMCLYYTNPGDAEFSEDKRVWPVQQADGSYRFTLPRTEVERLRLDPVSIKGLELEFGGFWLNEPQPVRSYFNPGMWGFVALLVGPALLAAALRWLVDVLRYYTAKVNEYRQKGARTNGE